jgi:hypothetical protein
MEQKSVFSTYGIHVLPLTRSMFKPIALELPSEGTDYAKKSHPELVELLRQRFLQPLSKQPKVSWDLKQLQPDAIQDFASTAKSAQTDPTEPIQQSAQTQYLELAAQKIQEGLIPMEVERMGGYYSTLEFLRPPTEAIPTFYLLEEYRTASYLGDYGAGQTVKTFTLLPGEKTTITVKTFKELTTTRNRSENVVDSFSQSSANELENLLEEQQKLDTTNSNTNVNTQSRTTTFGGGVNATLGATIGKFTFKVGAAFSGGVTNVNTNTNTVVNNRTSNVNHLSKALSKHVENSNSNRQMTVNTSTQESYKESEEVSTVRNLENINKSRVLNFVFRQLLQEYVSITYLDDVKIVFSNGYPGHFETASLQQIDEFLAKYINDANIVAVKNMILNNYLNVENHEGQPKPFLQAKEITNYDGSKRFYHSKKRGVIDTYTRNEILQKGQCGLEIGIKGVILNVDVNILRTDSIIADALLGQGEALDCFNAQLQDAAVVNALLQNAKLDLSIDIERDGSALDRERKQLENNRLPQTNELDYERLKLENNRLAQTNDLLKMWNEKNPDESARAYSRIVHGCCDVPQTGGCGCHAEKQ